MMKKPESHEPTNTANAAHQWPMRLSRRSPYRNNPRNADSRKNENTPSITSGCPITPPGDARELGPIGAELELHGDAGHHAHHEK